MANISVIWLKIWQSFTAFQKQIDAFLQQYTKFIFLSNLYKFVDKRNNSGVCRLGAALWHTRKILLHKQHAADSFCSMFKSHHIIKYKTDFNKTTRWTQLICWWYFKVYNRLKIFTTISFVFHNSLFITCYVQLAKI